MYETSGHRPSRRSGGPKYESPTTEMINGSAICRLGLEYPHRHLENRAPSRPLQELEDSSPGGFIHKVKC